MLKVGFSRLDVTPPLGSDISGYFFRRLAKGVLDPLYLNAVAIECDGERVVLMAIDYIGITLECINKAKCCIAERTGLLHDHIMISALHQHTSPCLSCDIEQSFSALRDQAYIDVLYRKFGDAAVMAIDDLKDATFSSAALETSEPIAFCRRYVTATGEFVTNPSPSEHTLVGRAAEADNIVRVLRFEREGVNDVALVNFSTHPDVIGGEYISADWPGFTRKFVESDLEGVSCIFFTGCQGDSNHVDRFKPVEEWYKGERYFHSEYMGRTVADAVISAWSNMKRESCEDGIFAESVVIYNKTNDEGKERYDEYKAWYDDYEAGKLSEKPNMTQLACARRIIKLKDSPDSRPVPLTVIGVGSVLFVGFGGEAFTSYGEKMRSLAPNKFVLSSVCTNGYQGYFPSEDAFYQGGYESGGSLFTPTLESEIVSAVKEILDRHI